MKWNKVKNKKPSHKDLVLCKNTKGMLFPAIYYGNDSFNGFYPFTLFYQFEYIIKETDPYREVLYDKIEDVVEWRLFPE